MGFIIGLLVIIGGAYAIWHFISQHDKKRTQSMRELANQLHMKFYENGVDGWEAKFSHFKFFQQGEERRMYNTLEGKVDDTSLLIFDYNYGIRRNQGRRAEGIMSHKVTVVLLDTHTLSLPAFEMQPLVQQHKMLRATSSDDFVFEDTPAFSEKYYLTADDSQAVRNLFDRQKMNFFISSPAFSIEGRGTQLLFHNSNIHTPSSRIEVAQLESRLKNCIEVAKVFTR